MKKYLFLLLFLSILIPSSVSAKIQFDALTHTKIDIEQLEITKDSFFSFIHKVVQEKKKGLGTYGKLGIDFCKITIKERPLDEYQTLKGRDVRYLSNPSCSQMVLTKVLTKNYGYNPADRSSYDNRKCIRFTEDITSPLFEYYTLHLELRSTGDCPFCEAKERERLKKIVKIRNKIKESCHSKSVLNFISDLDSAFETAFKDRK